MCNDMQNVKTFDLETLGRYFFVNFEKVTIGWLLQVYNAKYRVHQSESFV